MASVGLSPAHARQTPSISHCIPVLLRNAHLALRLPTCRKYGMTIGGIGLHRVQSLEHDHHAQKITITVRLVRPRSLLDCDIRSHYRSIGSDTAAITRAREAAGFSLVDVEVRDEDEANEAICGGRGRRGAGKYRRR